MYVCMHVCVCIYVREICKVSTLKWLSKSVAEIEAKIVNLKLIYSLAVIRLDL